MLPPVRRGVKNKASILCQFEKWFYHNYTEDYDGI
jgi:hypothetical protein